MKAYCSKMAEVKWRLVPVVVTTIHILDRNPRELFLGNIVDTHNIDADHFPNRRVVANTKSPHTAMFAKIVMVLFGVEQILYKVGFALKNVERFRLGDHGPETRAPADRAITTIGVLRQIDRCFEFDCAAVATAVIGFEHLVGRFGKSAADCRQFIAVRIANIGGIKSRIVLRPQPRLAFVAAAVR